MRLQTDAFINTAPNSWVVVLGIIAVICALTVVANPYASDGARVVFGALLVFSLAFVVINLTVIGSAVPVEEKLGADLKSQLGIERVSYDEEYRTFTGEKDGEVLSCVLFEEGDRGNVYEVICK